MTNEEYIHNNREADIRSLALKKVPEGVNALWCMRQIEGYQLARKKLPQWADTDGLWYPSRISMEQCSSETSAKYKADIVTRLLNGARHCMIDLTGGFGVDFSYMARGFEKAFYVERQAILCEAVRHNMPLLGLHNVIVINGTAGEDDIFSEIDTRQFDIIFLDPARRDDVGKKTIAIEDCTPDITRLQDELLLQSRYVIVKLSPMLDITQALRNLKNVVEVHVVSVKGECKELLFVLSKEGIEGVMVHCVNLDTGECSFVHPLIENVEVEYGEPVIGNWMLEPNASIMKAGMQNAFAKQYGLKKLHPMSNLFITEKLDAENVPARQFRIVDIYDFSKMEIKRLRSNMKQANITIRNFPSSVDDVRRRLKLKEGGKDYLFVTTLMTDSRHVIIHCVKP